MGILDKLLAMDATQLVKKESKEFEVTRLSELLGEPFIVTISPLSAKQVEYIGEVSKGDMDIKRNTVVEACKIDGKKFTDDEIMNKFGEFTGNNVVGKLFNAGEISALYAEVSKLSGYNLDAIKEIVKK
jgi:hypothetical protein